MLVTGITTLSTQQCRQGTQVSISAKVETTLLAGQIPVSDHLSPTPLVATYENHSLKRPAPGTDTF